MSTQTSEQARWAYINKTRDDVAEKLSTLD